MQSDDWGTSMNLGVVFFSAFFVTFSMVGAAHAERGSIMKPTPDFRLCNAPPLKNPGPLPEYLDIEQNYADAFQSDASERIGDYAVYLTSLTSRALTAASYREQLASEILSVARQKPLKWPPEDGAPHYHELLWLTPYVIAYAHTRGLFEKSEQKEIETWIKSRFKLIEKTGLAKQRTNNRVYHYGAALSAYGYAVGSKSHMRKAYGIYKTAIDKLRVDGSFLEDSERGGSALHYTNSAIGNLVAIAEILETAGYDAYGYSNEGRSLHLAIGFLMRANANPSLIEGYASSNPLHSAGQFPGTSPARQSMSWKTNEQIGWAYFYIARFPQHENSRALLSASDFLRSGGVGRPSAAFGNARCFLGG
jgi:hypothetical protein